MYNSSVECTHWSWCTPLSLWTMDSFMHVWCIMCSLSSCCVFLLPLQPSTHMWLITYYIVCCKYYIFCILWVSSLLMCCPVPEMSCPCFCWVLVTDLSGVFCSFVACCVLEMFLAWPVQTFLAFAGTAAEQPFLAWNQTCAWWPGTSGTGWIN